MKLSLKIIPIELLEQYKKDFDKNVKLRFEELHDSELSIKAFSFYTSVSAVYSSKLKVKILNWMHLSNTNVLVINI